MLLPIAGEVAAKPPEGRDGGAWADLGAGEGNFTRTLADLVGPDAHITAIDKDASALHGLSARFETRVADFTKPLDLHDLDGVVMANSLHFLRKKDAMLQLVRSYLRPGGRLLLVEYDTDHGNMWVPYPLSYPTWEALARQNGFTSTQQLATVPSRFFGGMYSAISI